MPVEGWPHRTSYQVCWETTQNQMECKEPQSLASTLVSWKKLGLLFHPFSRNFKDVALCELLTPPRHPLFLKLAIVYFLTICTGWAIWFAGLLLWLSFYFLRLGPMQTALKQRKVAVYRNRVKPTQHSKPEEVHFVVKPSFYVHCFFVVFCHKGFTFSLTLSLLCLCRQENFDPSIRTILWFMIVFKIQLYNYNWPWKTLQKLGSGDKILLRISSFGRLLLLWYIERDFVKQKNGLPHKKVPDYGKGHPWTWIW